MLFLSFVGKSIPPSTYPGVFLGRIFVCILRAVSNLARWQKLRPQEPCFFRPKLKRPNAGPQSFLLFTHCLGMSYYVNFLEGLGSNAFHIKRRFGTHGSRKNQDPGGRLGATS